MAWPTSSPGRRVKKSLAGLREHKGSPPDRELVEVRLNAPRLTIELTKKGKRPIYRSFQVGPDRKILRGVNRNRNRTIEVLDLMPVD